jgi:3-oxoacyl-[acyl-carrier-protein] synthase III
LLAEPDLRHVLCVGVDVLPPDLPREMLYNVVSDAAAAVIVSRAPSPACLRWLDAYVVSKGYYWDVPARQKEIIASYFPTSRLVIRELLARNRLAPADLAHLVPTGVGADSWPVLARLCGIPADRLRPAAGSFGHTIAADNFLHLAALRANGDIHPGDKLLLFTYGFGSSWCGLLLELPST